MNTLRSHVAYALLLIMIIIMIIIRFLAVAVKTGVTITFIPLILWVLPEGEAEEFQKEWDDGRV